ncbi:MAG: RDD family protein [Armatimonadetes bacterium]|nr:RDD family protein [Armatimonadota bacterium]
MRVEHRIVTPECVEFVHELGGLGSRALAAGLDHALAAGLVGIVWISILTVPVLILTGGAVLGFGILATFLIYFGYFTYFEWSWSGQTPGKRLLDLRVIDERGIRLELPQVFLRNLFRVVDLMPLFFGFDFVGVGGYGVGGLAALLSPRRQRLGDWAAGTVVVRVRRPPRPGALLAPGEQYNSLLQDRALRERIRASLSLDERETLLQLCLRRGELEYAIRHDLFAQAAAALEARLGVRRETFLSEEKFVQNVTAAALEPGSGRQGTSAGRFRIW